MLEYPDTKNPLRMERYSDPKPVDSSQFSMTNEKAEFYPDSHYVLSPLHLMLSSVSFAFTNQLDTMIRMTFKPTLALGKF